MTRSLPLWIGKTDDARIPDRVRVRLFDRAGGRCQSCGRKIMAGDHWDADHIIALVNGGRHAEDNLRVLCPGCHKGKTAEDVAEKAATYAVRSKHILPRRPSRLKGPGFPKFAKQHTATTPHSKWRGHQ